MHIKFFSGCFLLWLRVLLLIWRFGHAFDIPPERSAIASLFDNSMRGMYPETEQEEAQARAALYGDRYTGDIMYIESSPIPYGAAVKDVGFRWPGFPGSGRIPYIIDSSLSKATDKILLAMEQYHNLTCIRFVKRSKEEDYIRLTDQRGCSSFVGRIGGEQEVHLGHGCIYVGTIVHELGHAIGLYHEHQRSDRDEHLDVFMRNVKSGQEHNFEMTPDTEEVILTGFNKNSIMMYGNFAFSSNPGKLMTMEDKTNRTEPLLDPYKKLGLDNVDIEEIRKLYECE